MTTYSIVKIGDALVEDEILTGFTLERALKLLQEFAKIRQMVFVSDNSLFGGYYRDSNGYCWMVK